MSFSKSKFTVISIVVLFLLSSMAVFLSQPANAQNKNKEVLETETSQTNEDELAEELNYIYNNIIITDENGQAKEVNLDKAKERYGYVPQEFKNAQAEVQKAQTTEESTKLRAMPKTAEQCYREKLESMYKGLVPIAQIQNMVENPNLDNAKAFSKAAIKAGIQGNVASMAAQIIYYNTECANNYHSQDQIQ